MIRLQDSALPVDAASDLAALQAIIDGQATYRLQVLEAKRLFSVKNVKGNGTFDTLKEHLYNMSPGIKRCGYCEDSLADEIEHVWPKSIYPERTFQWRNLLYACGPCNSPKGEKFEVYRHSDGRRVNVAPRHGASRSTPPPVGLPLLIDPRTEDPFDFLLLDLPSGSFIPRFKLPPRSRQRAKYTIEVLRLNKLERDRRAAYVAYRSIVGDDIRRRDASESPNILQELTTTIYDQPHITVWREMQRQWNVIPELRVLFTLVPEALEW